MVHQSLFLFCKLCRVGRVDSREVATLHLVCVAFEGYGACLIVDMREQVALFHLPFRMFMIKLCFHLKLHHGNSLVHLSCQALGLSIHVFGTTTKLRHKLFARVAFVGFHSKGGKRHKVDAVALFQSGEVRIT